MNVGASGKGVQDPGHSSLRCPKNFRRRLVDELEAPEETRLVGNLDLESRACIQFEEQRTSLLVDHQIHTQVVKAGHIDRLCCDDEHPLPVRHLYPRHGLMGVGVVSHNPGSMNASQGRPPRHIDSNTDRPAMKIGLPIGSLSRKANHTHRRHAAIGDNSYVRDAAIGHRIKDHIGVNKSFDEGPVLESLERIDSRQNVGDVVGEIPDRDDLAILLDKTSCRTLLDKHNTAPSGAPGRFDDEILVTTQHSLEAGNIPMMLNHMI